jgi:DNA invertase Pin-like site-specific DNA recombinase
MDPTVIYCRISSDRDGLSLGVQRQEEDCRARAEREGLHVSRVYVDNDISASGRVKKQRPEYEEMMAAVERGEIRTIIAYSNSRLTRRLMEYERLIRLHDETGVRFLTVVSGDDNLSTADGRMVARIKATVDAAEAERTRERVVRSVDQRAKDGKFHGGKRPYGWVDGIKIDPAEARIIREIARRIIAGESLRGIAARLNDRGVPAATGGQWFPSAMRRMILSPRMAGWRVRKGDRTPAAWKPILTGPVWLQVCSILEDPKRRDYKPAGRVNLLTGIARCGECDRRISSAISKGRGDRPKRPQYYCPDCKLYRAMPPVDAYIEGAMIQYLEDAGDPERIEIDTSPAEELRDRIQQAIAEFTGDPDVSPAQLRTILRDLKAQLAEAERRQVPPRKSTLLRGMTGPGAEKRWDALELDQKRAMISEVLEVRLVRSPPGRRPFDPETVEINPR